jgi:hypothetical protein
VPAAPYALLAAVVAAKPSNTSSSSRFKACMGTAAAATVVGRIVRKKHTVSSLIGLCSTAVCHQQPPPSFLAPATPVCRSPH